MASGWRTEGVGRGPTLCAPGRAVARHTVRGGPEPDAREEGRSPTRAVRRGGPEPGTMCEGGPEPDACTKDAGWSPAW